MGDVKTVQYVGNTSTSIGTERLLETARLLLLRILGQEGAGKGGT